MLSNPEMFDVVEETLRESGQLERYFGDEPYRGRMMIDVGEVPDDLDIELSEDDVAFIATFDFYDCALGLALNPVTRKACGGIWITPQVEGAEPPNSTWIEFFVKTLMESIEDDGSFGYPIYTFVSDTKDLTVVPARPDA